MQIGFPAAPAAGEGSQALGGGGTVLVGRLSRKFSGTPPRFGTRDLSHLHWLLLLWAEGAAWGQQWQVWLSEV